MLTLLTFFYYFYASVLKFFLTINLRLMLLLKSCFIVGFLEMRPVDNNGYIIGGAAICITHRQVCYCFNLCFFHLMICYLLSNHCAEVCVILMHPWCTFKLNTSAMAPWKTLWKMLTIKILLIFKKEIVISLRYYFSQRLMVIFRCCLVNALFKFLSVWYFRLAHLSVLAGYLIPHQDCT